MALEPQAALETAVLNLLRRPADQGGGGFGDIFCGRRFDGRPPAVARGKFYLAVWSDGSVRSGDSRAQATALDETYGLTVTATVEGVQPFDRLVERRDELDRLINRVRAIVHRDVYANGVINEANELAGLRRGDDYGGGRVGFVRGLAYLGRDQVQEAGPDWFGGDPERGPVGLRQAARFGGATLIQSLATLEPDL